MHPSFTRERALKLSSKLTFALVLCAQLGGCESNEGSLLDSATVINSSSTPDAVVTGASDAGAGPGMSGGPGGAGANDAGSGTLDAALMPRPDASVATPDAAAADTGLPAIDGAAPALDASSGDAAVVADAGTSDAAAAMPGTVPIPAPAPDGCVTRVTAGDHTLDCKGVSFQVMVDERCTKFACGLIFDVHGAVMTGQDMRNNVRLHHLAPPKGFLTVHPTAPGSTWDWTTHPKILVEFMTSMIKAFHVDTKRVHFTGFSMGSGMTFWFLCNHRDVLASVAPVTGSSATQVTTPDGMPCIESIGGSWQPRVPILFMSGSKDGALTIDAARMRSMGIVSRLGLTGGMQIAGDANFSRKHWEGEGGMVFDFLEHNYENLILAGHCIPGGPSGDLFACDGSGLNWGQVVLQWFIDHPKR